MDNFGKKLEHLVKFPNNLKDCERILSIIPTPIFLKIVSYVDKRNIANLLILNKEINKFMMKKIFFLKDILFLITYFQSDKSLN